MIAAVNPDDVREVVAMVAADEYVNGIPADVDAHERTRFPMEPYPPIRRDYSWDRYVYFFYVGAGLTASSGFRYTGQNWIPVMVSSPTSDRIEDMLERMRDADDAPLQDKWNAAAITYERVSGTGNLYLFYGEDAEAWHMTPANSDQIAVQGWALFGQPGVG